MRVVLDSNVLVAAFATPGLCHEILEVALMEDEVFVSKFILKEVERILIDRIKVPRVQVLKNISFLKKIATIVLPTSVDVPALRDEDDLAIIGTAVAAQADVLVSGDKDLLVLKKVCGIPVLSPREFVTR